MKIHLKIHDSLYNSTTRAPTSKFDCWLVGSLSVHRIACVLVRVG